MSEIIVDADDLHQTNNRLDLLFQLKAKIPNFKITLFTIPAKCTQSFLEEVNKLDWIQLFLHGENHTYLECKNWQREYTQEYLDKYEKWNCFKKGFKSPYWRGNPELYKVLEERGYILAENKRVDYNGKLYLLGKNSVHCHIQNNSCNNGLRKMFKYISELKGEFKFISEIFN